MQKIVRNSMKHYYYVYSSKNKFRAHGLYLASEPLWSKV